MKLRTTKEQVAARKKPEMLDRTDQEILSMLGELKHSNFKQLCLSNIELFAAYYFGDQLLPFKNFHTDILYLGANARRVVLLISANHGKTVCIAKILPIFELCRNPNVEMLLVAHTRPDAEMSALAIMEELESNDKLTKDFGEFKPTIKQKNYPWGSKKFNVGQRTKRSRDCTIETFGTGSSIFGHRGDLVIMDDILDLENTHSVELRAKTRRWHDEAIVKVLDPTFGREVIIGTPMHPQDMYNDFMDEGEFIAQKEDADLNSLRYQVYLRQAITYDDVGKPSVLWPERWTYERLMEEKRQGTIAFERRFQCIAYPEDLLRFKEEDIERIKKRSTKIRKKGKDWNIYVSVDPAIGKSVKAKFFAALAIGVNPKRPNERYIIDLLRDKIEPERQVPLVVDFIERYGANIVIVEENAFQWYFKAALEKALQGKGVRVIPHQTGREKNDFEYGVDSLVPTVEQGFLHIPWGDDESKRVMRPFVDELMRYPAAATSDCIMAWWFFELFYKQRTKTAKSFRRKLPYLMGGDLFRHRKRTVKNPFYDWREETQEQVVQEEQVDGHME